LKNHEEFRASVYARAQHEKQRMAARRLKARNASLSVAMVLLVAALAVPLARSTRTDADHFTAPATAQEVLHTANRAAPLPSRMVLLVATPSGGTQAVVLENNAQQKDFVDKYKAAMHLGDDEGLPMTPAADTAKTICSTDELTEFLAELPEAAGAVVLDYDELFFEDNMLCAMPMDLSTQQAAEPDGAVRVLPNAAQLPTIPDGTSPAEGTLPESTEPETTEEEPTVVELQTLPESRLLQGTAVKVLLLVPVNKG